MSNALADQMRRRIAQLEQDRAARQAELDALNDTVEARGDGNLTDEETTQLRDLIAAVRGIDDQLTEAEARVAELVRIEEQRTERDAARRAAEERAGQDPDVPTDPNVRGGADEPVYRQDGEHQFFTDAYNARFGHNSAAAERLRRHQEQTAAEARRNAELRAAVGTPAAGGLIPPTYLTDLFAEDLKNGRAFANAANQLPLPSGMSLVIPRAEAGTGAASQDGQNVAVNESTIDYDNDLAVPVRTIAGSQPVSRQWIERGGPGLDRLVYSDLVGSYAQELDRQIIAASGTNGTHEGVLESEGINAVTWTTGSPTLAGLWAVVADAIQRVATNRKLPANLIVMHPRRWGWMTSQLGADGRPLINTDPSQAINVMGASAGAFGEGQLVGVYQTLPVLVDANVPTALSSTQDAIIVCRRQDAMLWEEGDGMPRELRFEQDGGGNTLTVNLVVYGYSAFTAERRPQSFSVITGTGLTTPAFPGS